MNVELVSLDRYNWEQYTSISLSEAQLEFVPPILFSLAQANFEHLTPLGIDADNQPIGFIMYGIFGGIGWINRLMIDEHAQGIGIGKQAVIQLIEMLKKHPQCNEIRTSYARNNTIAKHLFTSIGFTEINDILEDEIVAVLSK